VTTMTLESLRATMRELEWAGIPERVRLAAEYCAKRGASVENGFVDVKRSARQPRTVGYTLPTITLTQSVVGGAMAFTQFSMVECEDSNEVEIRWTERIDRVRITGASDADVVALRLAGFAPEGDAWVWREGA
jgi:hypothetical protein